MGLSVEDRAQAIAERLRERNNDFKAAEIIEELVARLGKAVAARQACMKEHAELQAALTASQSEGV